MANPTGRNTANFDPLTYLRDAGQLFKGQLADNTAALKKATTERAGTLWEILALMIAYAGTAVFTNGDYTRKKAKKFKEDVMGQLGISAKQAGKWTESISAALGVRGLRKGVRPMDGLMAVAKTGPSDVKTFLMAKELMTFNQFMTATRTEKDPVQEIAKRVYGLSTQQRERLERVVAKLDEDANGESDDDDDDSSAHAKAP